MKLNIIVIEFEGNATVFASAKATCDEGKLCSPPPPPPQSLVLLIYCTANDSFQLQVPFQFQVRTRQSINYSIYIRCYPYSFFFWLIRPLNSVCLEKI